MQPFKAHNLKTESLTDKGTALLDTAFKNTALLKKLDILLLVKFCERVFTADTRAHSL